MSKKSTKTSTSRDATSSCPTQGSVDSHGTRGRIAMLFQASFRSLPIGMSYKLNQVPNFKTKVTPSNQHNGEEDQAWKDAAG